MVERHQGLKITCWTFSSERLWDAAFTATSLNIKNGARSTGGLVG